MIRSQILLTPELDQQIKKISKNNGISQSEAVRRLLQNSLGGIDRGLTKKSQHKQKYLYSLDEFSEENPRIDGFKELYSVGAKTTEIEILGDRTFRYYEQHKKLPAGLEEKILHIAESMKEHSETQTLVVRRAYVVPGLENPPGPRHLGLKPTQVIDSVKDLYDFALAHDYHLPEKSRICVIIHPFADPLPLSTPIKEDLAIPYGGYATPLNKESSRVEIFAVWGNNEGVQSFDAVDRYIVDTKRMTIMEKNVPQKDVMLATTKKKQADKLTVPLDKQFEQVLSDAEILEAGRIVSELGEKYGLRRVEFSFDGRESLEYLESSPYEVSEKKIEGLDVEGTVFIVKSEEDVRLLGEKSADDTVVYIDKNVVEERNYDLLNSVAGLEEKFTILYPGLSATAHAMRVLSDFGHTAITVGNRKFLQGEQVKVKVQGNNQVQVSTVKAVETSKYILDLFDAKLYGNEIIGGKALNLSVLKSKGFNVPHGVVLTTKFYEAVLKNSLKDKDIKLISSKEGVSDSVIKKLAGETFIIPDKLWGRIEKSELISKKFQYAVRSSATVEDQENHSFAGQFETYLTVPYENLQEKIAKVVQSTFSTRIAQYFCSMNKPWSTKMAIVVQEMVDVEKAGVVFCKDIQTGNEDSIIIDVAPGLGEGVVDGVAKTQRIIYSKSRGSILQEEGDIQKLLSPTELNALIEMSLSIERLMGGPQDIEWAIDREGVMWLVQTRSI